MADTVRLQLRFRMDSPMHRDAWEVLSRVPPGNRTEAVCRALLAEQNRDALKNTLREVMREELKSVSITTTKSRADAAGDDDAVLGFLRALQEGDDAI